MSRMLYFTAGLLLLAAGPVAALTPDLGTEQQRSAGKLLYDKYCAQCHGETGDGKGYATPRVKPEPRDFTSGKYKFRTTPSGAMPTDDDLRRVIRVGLPYTSMPGWPSFSDAEVQEIIYYLKSFSEDFSSADKLIDPIEIPSPPAITEESVARGRQVYEAQGCAACHGDQGRGDGRSAPTMSDDWENHLRPADMTMRWTFRGGPTREDIFRTFSTGLNGTPMPSYGESLPIEERWDLVNYIYSLGDADEPNYSELLVVSYVADELDTANADKLFEQAPPSRFPLIGQIVQPGRNFYPSTTSVTVQAVHNKKEIALRIRWNDMRAETDGTNSPTLEVPLWDVDQPGKSAGADEDQGGFWGDEEEPEEQDIWGDEVVEEDEGDFWDESDDDAAAATGAEFSDAVAVQFPSQMPTSVRKPYFLLGDGQGSIDMWFVNLGREFPRQFIGRGRESVEANDVDELEVTSGFDNGQWTVVLKRSMRARGGVSMDPEQFVPIAFSVWDGFNRERGNKRALSAWFHLYVESDEVVSPLGPMVRAGLLVLGVEILLIFFIRRKFATPGAPASPEDRILTQRRAPV